MYVYSSQRQEETVLLPAVVECRVDVTLAGGMRGAGPLGETSRRGDLVPPEWGRDTWEPS